MGTSGNERAAWAWLPLLGALCACGADGARMPRTEHGLGEERVRLRWPDLPEVKLTPRPPEPAGPASPDPRWEVLFGLAHPDSEVRLMAVHRSTPYAKESLVHERLLELVGDPEPEVAMAAMDRLDVHLPDVRERLFVVLRDRRGDPRRVAARMLVQSGHLRGRWSAFAYAVAFDSENGRIHLY
ncbi:MAG: hypothetical protein JJ863_37630 [Deltaproteobacteria bacterium]|nr:hypothetical protein [Deltaproteobacteria bacterium]